MNLISMDFTADRLTVLIGTRTHTLPTLFQAGSTFMRLSHRHIDLLGLHRLITGMEEYNASPAESRLPTRSASLSLSLTLSLSLSPVPLSLSLFEPVQPSGL